MQQLKTGIAVAPHAPTSGVLTQTKKKLSTRHRALFAVVAVLMLGACGSNATPAASVKISPPATTSTTRPTQPGLEVAPRPHHQDPKPDISQAAAAHAKAAQLIAQSLQQQLFFAQIKAKQAAMQSVQVKHHGCTTLEDCRSCVTNVESLNAGLYKALNPSGSGGRYQVMPITWGNFGGFANAVDAPPKVQDQWFNQAYVRYHNTPTWSKSLYTDGC